MQRRLCEMSEAKWCITEAKCLQISHNKYASQRDAISPLMGNLMLSHSAGMHHPGISIAGICPNKFERAKGSKRFHFASLHYIFSAYLPIHIKFLTEFHRIFFGTTCISFPFFSWCCADLLWNCSRTEIFLKNSFLILYNVWAGVRLAHCFFGAVLACEKVFGVSGCVPVVCGNLWKFV